MKGYRSTARLSDGRENLYSKVERLANLHISTDTPGMLSSPPKGPRVAEIGSGRS